jgi:hypothetical protein
LVNDWGKSSNCLDGHAECFEKFETYPRQKTRPSAQAVI